jgi:hypothetical protein
MSTQFREKDKTLLSEMGFDVAAYIGCGAYGIVFNFLFRMNIVLIIKCFEFLDIIFIIPLTMWEKYTKTQKFQEI